MNTSLRITEPFTIDPSFHNLLNTFRFTTANMSQTCPLSLAYRLAEIWSEGLGDGRVSHPYVKQVYEGIVACYRARAKELSARCTWPGCHNPGLCQSGNFGNQVVCSEHFMVTNGPEVARIPT